MHMHMYVYIKISYELSRPQPVSVEDPSYLIYVNIYYSKQWMMQINYYFPAPFCLIVDNENQFFVENGLNAL